MKLRKQYFIDLLTDRSTACYFCKHNLEASYHLPCSICFKDEDLIRCCFELDLNKFKRLSLESE